MKYIIVLLLMCACFISSAQDATVYDAKLTYEQTYHYYTGQAGDTLGVADTVWTYTYWKLSEADFKNYTQVKLDSVSGTPASVSILFETRINKYAPWITDSTVVWAGSSVDTLITYDVAARPFPYRRIKVLDSDGTFKIKVNQLRNLFLK